VKKPALVLAEFLRWLVRSDYCASCEPILRRISRQLASPDITIDTSLMGPKDAAWAILAIMST
jgi:hypothetical protein